jgi:hypothetical protein
MPRSPLDIVRRSLGGHEIATVQTTAIDKGSGMDPPDDRPRSFVGRMAAVGMAGPCNPRDGDPASHGGGADHARHYALFTLVGIAGEDDLDAPDLGAGAKIVADTRFGNGNGVATEAAPTAPILKSRIFVAKAPPPVASEARQSSSAPRGPFWRPNNPPGYAIVCLPNSMAFLPLTRQRIGFTCDSPTRTC